MFGKRSIKKKGISPVIATILLVLITIAAISIIFVVFRTMIPRPVSDDCLKVDIVLNAQESCYNKSYETMKVQVSKGGNEVDIQRLQFLFSYPEGEESNIQEVNFDPNSEGIFYFNMSDINNGEKPISVSVASIVILSDDSEKLCDKSEEVPIFDKSCPIPLIFRNGNSTGWFGCTDDAWCKAKFNREGFKCVLFPFTKKGACCWHGYCSSGGSGGGHGGNNPPAGCTHGTCDTSTASCGQIFPEVGGTCNVNCDAKGTKCEDMNFICYQESANVSTACGGFNTGSYSGFVRLANNSLINLPAEFYDGNWGSGFEQGYADLLLEINYTKPLGASRVGSKWAINDSTGYYELAIPQECWNSDKLALTVYGVGGAQLSYSCGYRGTNSWQSFSLKETGTYPNYFYEEAMIWNISQTTSGVCNSGSATCNYIIPGNTNGTECGDADDCNAFDSPLVIDCSSNTEKRITWGEGVCVTESSSTGSPLKYCRQNTYINITACPSPQTCSGAGVCSGGGSCTDSDGGINYYVKGQVVGPIGPAEGSHGWDYCFDGEGTPISNTGDYLLEWSCTSSGSANQTIYQCPNGCSDGACNGAVCPSGEILCNGNCVNTLVDNSNCGGCGNICTGNFFPKCSDGKCCELFGLVLCQGTPPLDCIDGTKNNDESDIDCGGSCSPCTNGKTCSKNTDCQSENCADGLCMDIFTTTTLPATSTKSSTTLPTTSTKSSTTSTKSATKTTTISTTK